MRTIGPFAIDEPIARGGHSVVHAAWWHGVIEPTPDVELVAKIALSGLEVVLHHENATLRAVEHPHVIAPFAFVDDATHAVLILPRAACSLHAHTGRLDDEQLAPVLVGVASGLAALHRAGFVHADVTAGNVLLLEDGSPVLSDLGRGAPLTSEAARADVVALVRAAQSVLRPSDDGSSLRELLARVEAEPVEAATLRSEIEALEIEARAFDVRAVPAVRAEPPTIVVD